MHEHWIWLDETLESPLTERLRSLDYPKCAGDSCCGWDSSLGQTLCVGVSLGCSVNPGNPVPFVVTQTPGFANAEHEEFAVWFSLLSHALS